MNMLKVIETPGDSARRSYGAALLRLASVGEGPAVATALCGMIGRQSVSARIRRLAAGHSESHSSRVLSVLSILVLSVLGLTDAVNTDAAQTSLEQPSAQAVDPAKPDDASDLDRDFVITGTGYWMSSRKPAEGVTATLYSHRGLGHEMTRLQKTTSDQNGKFQFDPVVAPNGNRYDRLQYVLKCAAADSPATVWSIDNRESMDRLTPGVFRGAAQSKGRVVDEGGRPVSGAIVESPVYLPAGIVPAASIGLPSAKTNENGLFLLPGVPVVGSDEGQAKQRNVVIRHPDFPQTTLKQTDNGFAELVLPAGCRIEGQVVDATDQQPVSGVIVSTVPYEADPKTREAHTTTDSSGRYVLNVMEGSYKLMLEDDDLVAEAQILDCRKGARITPEPLLAQPGGWIVGQVIDTSTGQPMIRTENRDRVAIGLFGLSRPTGKLIYQDILTEVDDEGRFRIRAFPGENFPYCVNIRGSRMAWDTRKQPPAIVEAGKETVCEMTFAPPETPEQKMAAARKILDVLPEPTTERVDGIVVEFRKLNHTVDKCEIWCLLMHELVAIGKPSVPTLCRELESTTEQNMLRRLGFALRAIGDPRAVPSLIRALPKTLQPPLNDYGLIVEDPALTTFMQTHDLNSQGGTYFDLKRPVREIHGALVKLTRRELGRPSISNVVRRKDQRALANQKKMYHQAASEWAAWWEAHWQEFDVDEEYARVDLPEFVPPDLSDYPTGLELTKNAEADHGTSGFVLSPIGDADNGRFFLDLDTRLQPSWPAELPRDDWTADTVEAAAKWAEDRGVDLMCVAVPTDDGVSYVLSGVDLQLWEIDKWDAKNLDQVLKSGQLPKGRKLEGNLLLHRDEDTGRELPARESSFLYLTSDQGLGVITVTDFVTEARDITGLAGRPPQGVGFNRGVRFELKPIAR